MVTNNEERNSLTQLKLKQLMSYDPQSGIFYSSRSGHPLGTVRRTDKSYVIISIGRHKYRAHRLAFLYMTGKLPSQLVDHQDGNGLNNSWENLREVCPVGNNRNQRLRDDNSSGVAGVYWNKKDRRWQVSIKTERGNRGYVGQFADLLDAVAARFRTVRDAGFHTNHGEVRPKW